MAVDFLGMSKIEEQIALQEAASTGLKSMEHLIRLVSHEPQVDCRELTDSTVSKFKKAINVMNRTGHARFRRAPLQQQQQQQSQHVLPSSSSQPQFNVGLVPIPAPVSSSPALTFQSQSLTLDFTKPNFVVPNPNPAARLESKPKVCDLVPPKPKDHFRMSPPLSTSVNSSSFMSSITGEGSVSNGKPASSVLLSPPAVSAGKPPVYAKRCREHDIPVNISGKPSASGKCHCKKR